MNISPSVILVILSVINIISFLTMLWDKTKARQGGRRVSEKSLFALALLLGGLGIYLGMFVFHHKTKKWYFIVGIPLIIVMNVYLLSRVLALKIIW